ncbi:CapA family protein [Streptococcus infantis]|uniref:CapA family protein n=1 Tax=Streptococcus infantis TaxID=68892 RepID=UPI001CBF04D5|nr:CapA family protein [Streptococcus infantis]MBZ2110904.1 CapA family protein [Streptococcus infantis]MBZ2112635.1 CapA family protein [Streptococcus infantis]MBZ2118618.1 CapA family protein [Streptococcus infantis]
MEQRSSRRKSGPVLQAIRHSVRFFRNYKQWNNRTFIVVLLASVAVSMMLTLLVEGARGISLSSSDPSSTHQQSSSQAKNAETEQETSARIMANGDLLYHDIIYISAKKSDGTYDFHDNFEYVKPWLKQADLVLGDFEGTVNKDHYLAGYPLFNAPGEVMDAIKDAGYQVLDLAHNHILDSQIEGVVSTADAIEKAGMTPVGVYTHESRDKAPLLIKEVNGIKVAILAYSYGFNGIEQSISQEDYNRYLSDLDEDKMKAEIERAEEEADITIIMPQMGVEYQIEPTEEQKKLYHKMIDWGADIIFGGHPHVVEPAETVEKDGDKKLIIYSMGNFISNQRIETMQDVENAKWTERGVLMDVTIKKKSGKTTIETAQAHPSWVSRTPKGGYSPEGYPLYLYQTYILEDFIEGGKYRSQLDEATKQRIDTAYKEMNEHVGLKW